MRAKHREAIAERNRERHQRLKDDPKYKEMLKVQRMKHKPKKALRSKKWKKENHERLMLEQKEKRKNDPQFRLAHNLRGRIRMAIIHSKGKKYSSSVDLLGCDIDTARRHLESLWTEGMSWENYGQPSENYFEGWHIDHIIPCANFDLTKLSEQKKCFHYTNLQPLWALDNLSKWKNEEIS